MPNSHFLSDHATLLRPKADQSAATIAFNVKTLMMPQIIVVTGAPYSTGSYCLSSPQMAKLRSLPWQPVAGRF